MCEEIVKRRLTSDGKASRASMVAGAQKWDGWIICENAKAQQQLLWGAWVPGDLMGSHRDLTWIRACAGSGDTFVVFFVLSSRSA